MNLANLGQQLKHVRQARKMTLKELAQRSGVHWVTLSRFENGLTDLGVQRLTRVARALGLEVVLRRSQRGYTLDDLARGELTDKEQPAPLKTRHKPFLESIDSVQHGPTKTT